MLGCLTKKENERVAASQQNARVLRDLASHQFLRRKEFKEKLLAGIILLYLSISEDLIFQELLK